MTEEWERMIHPDAWSSTSLTSLGSPGANRAT
jgi:hypothetical protein